MQKKDRSRIKKILVDIAGFGLIIAAPFFGWLPGPGGIPMAIAGLAMLATNHEWAENLLRDFDDKRQELTTKYLVGNRRVAWIIDSLSVVFIGCGVVVSSNADVLWQRGLGIGGISFGIILLISNQQRLDRLLKKLKK